MNRFYNHIKHLVDNKDQIKNIRRRRQVDKYDATQLDGKQRHWHTEFDYYEYHMPKFGTLSWAKS